MIDKRSHLKHSRKKHPAFFISDTSNSNSLAASVICCSYRPVNFILLAAHAFLTSSIVLPSSKPKA